MEKSEVIFQDADRHNVSGAETRHHGLELGLNWSFASDWRLGLDMTLARHKYDSPIQLLGSSGDIEGNDIDTAPRAFGSARLDWDLTSLTGREARAQLEWVHLGSYYLEPDNNHKYSGHDLLNLRLETSLGRNLRAALRITNLLDEDYAERADYGFGDYRYFVGQPLGAYLELSYHLR